MATTPNPLNPIPTAPYTTSAISVGQLKASDLQDPNLGLLNTWKSQIENQINAISGTGGPAAMPAGIDVQSKGTVTNLPAPSSKTSTDAASAAHVESNYSAGALAPQLEAGNNTGLKSYRALNSKAQRENNSVFLEGMLNTAPTGNTSTITPGTGNEIVVSAGYHQFVSGNIQSYQQRTDTLAAPPAYTINTISRTGNMVTATLTTTSALLANDSISVEGVTDPTYDGTFTILISTSGGQD